MIGPNIGSLDFHHNNRRGGTGEFLKDIFVGPLNTIADRGNCEGECALSIVFFKDWRHHPVPHRQPVTRQPATRQPAYSSADCAAWITVPTWASNGKHKQTTTVATRNDMPTDVADCLAINRPAAD